MRARADGTPAFRTTSWRYGTLYSTARPHSRVSARLRRVGIATPMVPVRASGFITSSARGRSPNPLAKNSEGVRTSNDDALTPRAPVPPISHPRPADSSASCVALSRISYFTATLTFPTPVAAPRRAGSTWISSPARDTPRLSVRRLANTEATSVVTVDGLELLRWNRVNPSPPAPTGQPQAAREGR